MGLDPCRDSLFPWAVSNVRLCGYAHRTSGNTHNFGIFLLAGMSHSGNSRLPTSPTLTPLSWPMFAARREAYDRATSTCWGGLVRSGVGSILPYGVAPFGDHRGLHSLCSAPFRHGSASPQVGLLQDARHISSCVARLAACRAEVALVGFGRSSSARAPAVGGLSEDAKHAPYRAPETHRSGFYDTCAADLFACGVVAYALATGEYPWASLAMLGGQQPPCSKDRRMGGIEREGEGEGEKGRT